MTISRLMLTAALIGTLALPALAQTSGAAPSPSHNATVPRHGTIKPNRPVHPTAARGAAAGPMVAAPDAKPTGGAIVAVPAPAVGAK